MNVEYLIQILQNKILLLNNAKNMAFANGDIETINSVDKQLFESQSTLSQLELLLAAAAAATATNTDLSTVVNAGVEAAQSSMGIPLDPSTIINGYDTADYAADPLYEDKLRDMLSTMPAMDSAAQIDAYISRKVVGSPLTGQMIFDATELYKVDTRLTMAIMELDSRFGTAGVGAVTNNPGNVGNTGTETYTFNSWAEGVAAVASWLDRHRVQAEPVAESIIEVPSTEPVRGEERVKRLKKEREPKKEEDIPPVEEPQEEPPVIEVPPPTPVVTATTTSPGVVEPPASEVPLAPSIPEEPPATSPQ